MEVSIVSPTPASPSEGANFCEIDVTNVAIDSVTLLICFCGLAGNGAVLWLLGFHIRRSPITIYILSLAVADFSFLLFAIPTPVLYLLEEASSSIIMPLTYQSYLFLMSELSYFLGLYLLTAFSIERCRSILCLLRCRCHHPHRLSGFVRALLSISIIDTVIFLCQSHNPKHCWVARTCMYALNLFLFAPATVISSTILFMKAKCGSQQRELKRLDIVVRLTVLVFILLALPLSLWNFLPNLGYTIMSSEIAFLLSCIHSSIKPFMYSLVGRCWRSCSMKSLHLSIWRVLGDTEQILSAAMILP